jgi:hypothetical protein
MKETTQKKIKLTKIEHERLERKQKLEILRNYGTKKIMGATPVETEVIFQLRHIAKGLSDICQYLERRKF